jgi:hypothetical protein
MNETPQVLLDYYVESQKLLEQEDFGNTVIEFIPQIAFWWDKFLANQSEALFIRFCGAGMLVVIAFIAVFKWGGFWKKFTSWIIKEPEYFCICKECGHAIPKGDKGDICRTCDWYKQV